MFFSSLLQVRDMWRRLDGTNDVGAGLNARVPASLPPSRLALIGLVVIRNAAPSAFVIDESSEMQRALLIRLLNRLLNRRLLADECVRLRGSLWTAGRGARVP